MLPASITPPGGGGYEPETLKLDAQFFAHYTCQLHPHLHLRCGTYGDGKLRKGKWPLELLVRIEGWLAGFLISAGATFGLLVIILRYFFGIGWPWTEGVVVMLTVWGALVAGATAIEKQEHISLDLVVKRLPPRLHKGVTVLAYLLTTLFVAALCWFSMNYVIFLFRTGATSIITSLPTWLEFLGVPVATLLMTIHGAHRTVSGLRKR